MKNSLVFDTTSAATITDSDSVGAYLRASDGTLLTHTDVGGKKALDVRVAEGINVEVDLSHVDDSVKVGDGTDFLAINADGSINITDNGGSLTVDAVNLDIRDLAFATDSVTAYQGTSPWVIGDGGSSITVDAVDLDIRDLSHTQDSVKIGDGTDFLAINADGSINVNADISIVTGHEKAEDAAHSSGDIGSYVLAVRQDTLANSVSADGDYSSFKVDANGALYVDLAASSATVTVTDAALANTAIANAVKLLTTGGTSENLVTSPLSNRKYLFIANNYNRDMFIGSSGVTTANGFPLSPGSVMELRCGAAIDIEFVSAATGHETRTLELS